MENPIKVLHVVGRMDRGGTETLIMNLLRVTDPTQFRYDIVEQTDEKCDYDDEIEALGGTIYRCPQISPRNLHQYRVWWKSFLTEHPEYQIIHGHSRGSAPIYLDEAKKAGRITIAHCHNNSHGKGIKGFIRYLWQLPLRKIADFNFACSYDSGVSQFGKHGRFEVIRNGIELSKFSFDPIIREKVRAEFDITDKFVIGNVARFEEQKNHKFLIHIFAKIIEITPNAVLFLVGQGSLENELRSLISDLGLTNSVIFAGLRSDVNEMYQAMDVFVLPSLFEGLGIVNIEAQAAGLHCFVSTTVAPEARVTDLLSYVSLNSNAENWAEQITAIPNESRRDTTAEIIAAGFDISSTAQRLGDFYREVLNNAK